MDVEADASLLPWPLIAEFLTLPEVLNTRLVSLGVIEAIHGLSPQTCGAFLEQALRERNMHLVPHGSWERPVQDESSLGNMLIRDNHEHTSSLDTMLRCFRVLKYLPMEVAVAFNGKYGRHCIPLEFSSETNSTEPKLYQPCSKKKCETCKLRIPPDDDPDAKIHAFIHIPNKRGKAMDLTHFYNKCVPNLPPDLICPSCRCSEKRTLVLSTLSYPSNATSGRNTLLTYTPRGRNKVAERDESGSDTETDEDEEQEEPQRKKQRVDNLDSFAYPELHDDLSFPSRWEPLERANDAKHGIAIHCVSCKNFGVVAPAGPCHDERFPCQERTRQVTIGKHVATIGGIFARRKCSNQDCLHAASCEACSRVADHPVYERDVASPNGAGDLPPTVAHKTRCQTCNLRYCNECAWLSTICHHW